MSSDEPAIPDLVAPWYGATTKGGIAYVLVPADSGGRHWVARCPSCHAAMWNEHGTRQAITQYVRVGTLDTPDALPPQTHKTRA